MTSQRPDLAVVTGAGSGLGAEIARKLHADGHHVVIADIDGETAQGVAQALDPSGLTASAVSLDVRDGAMLEALVARLEAERGGVQILVNNAAVTMTAPLLEIGLEEFDAVMAVNLRGTFAASQVFGRRFKAAGYGRIVNIASLAGQNGGSGTGGHYAASKGGIITLTKVFARELASFGVTVNAVAPGPLDTPKVRELATPERLAQLVDTIPVRQIGQPTFIADITARLAARDAGFVTGATWDINGGIFMR